MSGAIGAGAMPGNSRRSMLKGLGMAGAAAVPGRAGPLIGGTPRPRVAVVGAGAFGGWTALMLQRMGAQVTLLDAWGPGNVRSSSGGVSRIMRRVYGPDRLYTDMASRSLELWNAVGAARGRALFRQTGLLWMVVNVEEYELAAMELAEELGHPCERFSVEAAAKRWPGVRFEGVQWVLWEPGAGYLLAREGCRAVVAAFLAEGGSYRRDRAEPGPIRGGRMAHVRLTGGPLEADHYVFACGAWLGAMFADLREDLVVPTRQEVFFFGTPPGDARFLESAMPAWINHDRGGLWYGVPGNRGRGFKIANDAAGPEFDPTAGNRVSSGEGEEAARDFLAKRFPVLADAPLLESRVCQYENSPDSHLLIDRHPGAENAWIVGGGSGHAYKMGPVVGEMAAALVLERREAPSRFRLSRFRGQGERPRVRKQW